jgi:hypothetical protein
MSQQEPKIADEMGKMAYEPLLPVEKKLITWSLAVGIGLLVVLAFISRMFI